MENPLERMREMKIVRKLPKQEELSSALSHFSKREWTILGILTLVLFVSALGILQIINKSFMLRVPLSGGSITEGIIGTPRFVNPILASSLPDQDLVEIIYSGLMRKDTNGALVPDLAEKYEISADGLVYTFTLKPGLTFHDGSPLTIEDVLFTINAIKDPVIKSPRRTHFEGVAVESPSERTIVFTLKQPYASFLENTTLGIMPRSLWQGSPIELNEANTEPVGSGPYKVKNISRQSSGVINSYELERFSAFSLGKPYLKSIKLHFFGSEEDMLLALEGGGIAQASSISPLNAKELEARDFRVESFILPRVFGLFFNQSQNQLFVDKNILKAVNLAVDKERIVRDVLSGYGVAINGPIPPNMLAYQKTNTALLATREKAREEAKAILEKSGWKPGESGFLEKTSTAKGKKTTSVLEFSISTGNAPELARSAEFIKQDLELLGMKVDVKTFEIGNLNQSVIRPRKYDVLLFGEIINHESDLFAFWHSSQRRDPGLNVAMYTSTKVDKILEDAAVTVDPETRTKEYADFDEEIRKDVPAVFLYSPKFIYVISPELKGLAMVSASSPKDRFLNIHLWYTQMDNVWKIFTHN